MRLGTVGAWLGGLAVARSDDARAAAREVEALGYGCVCGRRRAWARGRRSPTSACCWRRRSASRWAPASPTSGRATRSPPLGRAGAGRRLSGPLRARPRRLPHPVQVDPRGHTTRGPWRRCGRTSTRWTTRPSRARTPRPTTSRARRCRACWPRCARACWSSPRERADGAHTYLVTPEHTARARGPSSAPTACSPSSSRSCSIPTRRRRAREPASTCRGTSTSPNYRNNLRWLGLAEADLDAGGTDAVVDALVAWGDEAAIRARIDEHRAAGADHVALQPLGAAGDGLGVELLRRVAPAVVA